LFFFFLCFPFLFDAGGLLLFRIRKSHRRVKGRLPSCRCRRRLSFLSPFPSGSVSFSDDRKRNWSASPFLSEAAVFPPFCPQHTSETAPFPCVGMEDSYRNMQARVLFFLYCQFSLHRPLEATLSRLFLPLKGKRQQPLSWRKGAFFFSRCCQRSGSARPSLFLPREGELCTLLIVDSMSLLPSFKLRAPLPRHRPLFPLPPLLARIAKRIESSLL